MADEVIPGRRERRRPSLSWRMDEDWWQRGRPWRRKRLIRPSHVSVTCSSTVSFASNVPEKAVVRSEVEFESEFSLTKAAGVIQTTALFRSRFTPSVEDAALAHGRYRR